ncbi:MAG: GntR family transcriptional regulator [Burkholderiales bacterium]|nr:GntR family transcriptional regulator [Burkholderiales bacterium]
MSRNDASELAQQLALRMADHLRRSGIAIGAHLAEQQFADELKVSRTPVRRALAVLAEMGVVVQEPNRGYFLRKLPPASVRPALVDGAGLAEERYLQIADDRLAGKLEEHVTETALMRRYGMPRRELQRVLHRMEKEGWIERKPGHGWMFVQMPDSLEAHAQSYRFRMLFEPASLLEPGFRLVKSELERVRRDQQMLLDGGLMRLSRARLFELGSDFHNTVIGFSNNRFMIDAIHRVNAMRRLLEYRAKFDRERITDQCREHLHLLELLEQGSRQEAAEFLRRHLDVVRERKTGMDKDKAVSTPRSTVTAQL